MVVFITSVKHPDCCKSYGKVWALLNNTLFSVCAQLNQNFRVIVVSNKSLPLFHHSEHINKFSEFIEVDFPPPTKHTVQEIQKVGTLSHPVGNQFWEYKSIKNKIVSQKYQTRIDKGAKRIIGILAARKYHPDYACFFDADDFVGNDISEFTNSNLHESGWIMSLGYKIKNNRIQKSNKSKSVCGTGNIHNFKLLTDDIPNSISRSSSQIQLFREVNTEFLMMVLGRHNWTRKYYQAKGCQFLDYPKRSVIHFLGHGENDSDNWRNNLVVDEKDEWRPITGKHKSYFNILEPKVFCIGFHKTGTKSLRAVLDDLKYNAIGAYKTRDQAFVEKLRNNEFDEVKFISKKFEAFHDNPWAISFKKLDEWYPLNKFILSIRNSKNWIASVVNHFGNQKDSDSPMRKLIYGYGNPVGHEKQYTERYTRHNKEVLEYFSERPGDLLIIDVSEKNALPKICDFLSRKTTFNTMPHENRRLMKIQ